LFKSSLGAVGASVISVLCFASNVRAQAPTSTASQQSQTAQPPSKTVTDQSKSPSGDNAQNQSGRGPSQANQEPPKRMFGMIPDFESTNDVAANRHSLTVKQKYFIALENAFDFSAHIGNAFQSGIQQAFNSQPRYGEGWGAYGKRFAASEGDQITGSFLIYGTLPVLFHEDPRYFRRAEGPAKSRIWYAINRTFVTRKDDGTDGFNRSQTLGQLVSCGISTSYYPAQDRSVGHVFVNWAVNMGYNSGYNVLTEYYADLLNALFHRHDKPDPQKMN
jgi:hypothetical protein